jgi:phosphoribosylformylglycinamidine cyclo-ligase
VEIQKGSWPILPVFDVMQSLGDVDEDEMFRTFNMGIGMTFIVNPDDIGAVTDALKDLTDVYEVGFVVSGEKHVSIN